MTKYLEIYSYGYTEIEREIKIRELSDEEAEEEYSETLMARVPLEWVLDTLIKHTGMNKQIKKQIITIKVLEKI